MSPEWLPLVSVVVVGTGIVSAGGATISHDVQTSLDVIEEIGNRIQLITAGGERSKDGKINENDGNEDRDNIDGVTEEGWGGAVTDSDCSSLSLCWKISYFINNFNFSCWDVGWEENKKTQESVHYWGWGVRYWLPMVVERRLQQRWKSKEMLVDITS